MDILNPWWIIRPKAVWPKPCFSVFGISALAICGLVFSTPLYADYSVVEAYQKIPHHRTVFDPQQTTATPEESVYLQDMFELVELATVERVGMLEWLRSGGESGYRADDYDDILAGMNWVFVPESMTEIHRLIVEAVKEQRDFLTQWRTVFGNKEPDLSSQPLIKRSSGRLRSAHRILVNHLSKESEHNKQAFFDYLCALDFL